jgi:hypothetical protein
MVFLLIPNLPRCARRAVPAALVAALLSAGAASSASAEVRTTDDCADQAPVLSQPFSAFKDFNSYFRAPGGDFADPASVADAGWQLSGGADVVPTTRPDGSTGYVLDLPSKSVAVSPLMCVTRDYPIARMYVRNVVGGEGVQFAVSYVGTPTEATPKNTGQVHGGAMKWQATTPINLQPAKSTDWQLVRFRLTAGGTTSRFQVTDLWVDPRMH